MKGIETGKDKVKKICDVLRRETLEPAMEEAEQIASSARGKAEEIISAARAEAEALLVEAKKEIAKERNVFQSSLGQACKQALESLKQNIESKLLDQELAKQITKQTQDPRLLAELITAMVKGIEKDGLDTSLSAHIPASVSPRAVNQLLAQGVLEKLKEKSVLVGNLTGGIEITLPNEKMTIDLSDKALKELVAQYIRKDFREMIFGS
jgi:V/A-type H+-transporting ATPase subunit E